MKRLSTIGAALVAFTLSYAADLNEGLAQSTGARAEAAVTAEEARSTLLETAALLEANYVFPETGRRYADALRLEARSALGAATAKEFAASVTARLQSVAKDGHLTLFVPRQGTPATAVAPPSPAIERTGWIADGVAYIKFSSFPSDEATLRQVDDFMRAHASARALIIDVRDHRGGGIAPGDVMLPYLFAQPAVLGVMETRAAPDAAGHFPFSAPTLRRIDAPAGLTRREHRIEPNQKERRLRDARVFYLTSRTTASAAEGLALALKRNNRATIIGETTRGAGHYGMLPQIGRFRLFLPIGRTYDPATGRGWEGQGIEPAVKVSAEKALDTALNLLKVSPAQRRF